MGGIESEDTKLSNITTSVTVTGAYEKAKEAYQEAADHELKSAVLCLLSSRAQ